MKIPHQVYEIQAICKNPYIKYGFLRGQGGSGKTYTISQFLKHSKVPPFRYLFVGPTGKSISVAEDKGMVGSTIHSFFMIQNNDTTAKIESFLIYKYNSMKNYYQEMKKKLEEIKYIFIDEISMVNDQLLLHILRTLEAAGRNDLNIFLSGDYHQLPAILKNTTANDSLSSIEELIAERVMKCIDFNTRYRSENEDFNEFLFDIRAGNIYDPLSISNYIKHFCNVYKKQDDIPDEDRKKLTYLFYSNNQVNDTNELILDDLPGQRFESTAKIIHNQYPINELETRDTLVNQFQMDEHLVFKEGSKILFRVNDPDKKFKNGDEGLIEKVYHDRIIVKKFSHNQETIIEIKKHIYRTGEMEIKDGYDIQIEQWPFSLGNARTIHKAQGDGFEYLHLDFGFFSISSFTNAYKWRLFYVQMSRIITPENVWITEDSIKLLERQYNLFKGVNHNRFSLDFYNDQMMPEKYLRRDIL